MAGTKKHSQDDDEILSICRNKRAFHEYEIFDTLECGIVLTGTEVKSLRERAASLEEAYAKIEGRELWLIGSDIPEYTMGNRLNHKPKRPRKLLLHRREIAKFAGKASQQGYTLVPLRMYFKEALVKVEIALATGKKLFDRRDDLKKKAQMREVDQALKRRGA
jgi:SsrA-binding protein